MKKFTLLFSVLIAINAAAQIPNNGFENWNNIGAYMDPQGYLTPNSMATSFYPVTRSVDHYPTSIGNYSIRLENNPSFLPNADALGLVLQNRSNNLMNGPGVAFPITGHPTSLTGYYKYLPLNGDTLRIEARLFNNGSQVSKTILTSSVSVSNWAPFSLSFPSYVSADSCSILIAAYNCDGPPPSYVPHGNSVLYVDNLNFDFLLTSITEQSAKEANFKMYPNPATKIINLELKNENKTDYTINMYNIVGELVYTTYLEKDQHQLNTEELTNGVYTLEIKTSQWSEQQKLIIQNNN